MGLTSKNKLFINEYLKDFNGTRAYKTAYPDSSEESARKAASRLLTKVDIQKAIEEESNRKLKELGIDVYYIIRSIKEVTERCMEKEPVQYFDKEDKCWRNLKTSAELPNGETVEATVVQFDSKNALRGLELLGKYKSLFKENIDIKVDTSKKLKDVFEQIGGEGLDE